MQPAEEHN